VEIDIVLDLGVRSQEFSKAPQLERIGKDTQLSYDFETETGEYKIGKLIFADAVHYRVTRLVCVEPWMVKAYDAVGVVRNSTVIQELKNTFPGIVPDYKHYVVFFEDYGCHEFLARDVSLAYQRCEGLDTTRTQTPSLGSMNGTAIPKNPTGSA